MSNLLQLSISTYKGVKDNTGYITTISKALGSIKKDPAFREAIVHLRSLPTKKAADAFKKNLPAVTWCGTFEKRKADKLIEYSNLICLDFDKLPAAAETKNYIVEAGPEFLLALFISPSGNGLKAVCVVDGGADQHLNNFLALAHFFKSVFNLEVDPSGKDVSRLCFLSFDENIFVNTKAVALQKLDAPKPVPPQPDTKKTSSAPPQTEVVPGRNFQTELEKLVEFTNQKNSYVDGNRNNYIHHFACNANRRGIPMGDTHQFIEDTFDIAHEEKNQTLLTVKSAYHNNLHEHGKYAPGYKRNNKTQATTNAINKQQAEYDESVKFWYEVENDDKKGETKIDYKFSYRQCIIFLSNNGFFRYSNDEKTFELVKVEGYLIDFVTETQIRDFIFKYLDTKEELEQVEEMLLRAVNRYLSSSIFERLPYIQQ